MTFLPFCSIQVLSLFNHRMNRFGIAITGLPCSFVMAVLMAPIGNIIGKWAATRPSVNSAFSQGAIDSGLLNFLFLSPFFLFSLSGNLSDSVKIICVFILFLISISTSVCFHSGLTAIYVRDYRQTGRKRPIPQFTLQEMLILFSLLTVIMSAFASFAAILGTPIS